MISRPTALLIGPIERSEFREARDAIGARADAIAVANCEAALRLLAETKLAPELIVVAHSRPGEHDPAAMERLRRAVPLASMVVLLGSWCEGEPRRAKSAPWPGAVRVYWHEFPARVARVLGDLALGRCSLWSLPATATDEERLLFAADRTRPKRGGTILVAARRRDMAEAIVDACRAEGFRAEWLPVGRASSLSLESPETPANMPHIGRQDACPTLAVWEGRRADAEEAAEIRGLRRFVGNAPIVALLDFPRPEDVDRAIAAGASAVVAKPLLLDDLFRQIDELLGANRELTSDEKTSAA